MKIERIAVVGCGALAQSVHLPNIIKNPRLELAAVCDVDAAAAQDCCRKFNAARAETDWHNLIGDKGIDLFLLATHTSLRGEFIIPAVEAGQPVYTEKPLAPSRQEMTDIVRACRRTGVPVCVGHNRRSSPAMLEFHRLLSRAASGITGTRPSVDRSGARGHLPEEAQLQLLMRINDDCRSWKDWIFWDDEGIMFAEMVHFIDLALWFNTAHPVRVFAEGSPRGNFSLLIRFDDGSLTTLQHSMVGNFDYPKELFEATRSHITVAMDQHIEVRQFGLADESVLQTFPWADDSGWAAAEGMTAYMQSARAERETAEREGRLARTLNVDKGHARHLDRFLDHIEGRGENPCSVESAVPVNRIAMKLLESSRLGLPVAVGPEDWHLPAV